MSVTRVTPAFSQSAPRTIPPPSNQTLQERLKQLEEENRWLKLQVQESNNFVNEVLSSSPPTTQDVRNRETTLFRSEQLTRDLRESYTETREIKEKLEGVKTEKQKEIGRLRGRVAALQVAVGTANAIVPELARNPQYALMLSYLRANNVTTVAQLANVFSGHRTTRSLKERVRLALACLKMERQKRPRSEIQTKEYQFDDRLLNERQTTITSLFSFVKELAQHITDTHLKQKIGHFKQRVGKGSTFSHTPQKKQVVLLEQALQILPALGQVEGGKVVKALPFINALLLKEGITSVQRVALLLDAENWAAQAIRNYNELNRDQRVLNQRLERLEKMGNPNSKALKAQGEIIKTITQSNHNMVARERALQKSRERYISIIEKLSHYASREHYTLLQKWLRERDVSSSKLPVPDRESSRSER